MSIIEITSSLDYFLLEGDDQDTMSIVGTAEDASRPPKGVLQLDHMVHSKYSLVWLQQ
jgi:hypothetical protein